MTPLPHVTDALDGHMFNEDGICDCTECWPTNTQRPNRETTMNLEVGKTYEHTDPDWAEAVKALQPGMKVEAWWKAVDPDDEIGRRRVVHDSGRLLCVGVLPLCDLSGQPRSDLLRFTVMEMPAHLDPAKALVVRDRDGDMWGRTADGWQYLGAPVSTESLERIAEKHGPLTVVIDADGNVVDEGDR